MSQFNLEALKQQWHSIQNRDERNRFYDEKVFPTVIEAVIPNEQKIHPESYSHLILPVGFSPEPLILSVLILRPEKVHFLYTKASQQYLDRIIKDTNLRISQVSQDEINDTNVPEIYQKVKAIYEQWGKPERVAVDISGGKKSMVGGCALAGSLIGAKLFYIDSKFNPEFKKPDPGTEKLMILDNPYDVFGDLKLEQAKNLFRQLDFVGTQRLLNELQIETSTPESYIAQALLCEAYSSWDDWKIELALEKMKQCVQIIERYFRLNRNTPLSYNLPRLREQLKILEKLKTALDLLTNNQSSELDVLTNPEFYLPMMATLRAGAIRQEQRGKLDVAALLWYRLIELFSQQRLSHYGLKTSKPDYSQCNQDETELLLEYKSVVSKVSRKDDVSSLPNPISLVQGYMLLQALKDVFTTNLNLQEILGKVKARDNGIFAHGFKPLSKDEYEKFKELAEKLVAFFQKSNEHNQNCWDDCQFIETL